MDQRTPLPARNRESHLLMTGVRMDGMDDDPAA
jgi:hypothetical protein